MSGGPEAVKTVQIQFWRAEIVDAERVDMSLWNWGRVESDIVINKLSEIRKS